MCRDIYLVSFISKDFGHQTSIRDFVSFAIIKTFTTINSRFPLHHDGQWLWYHFKKQELAPFYTCTIWNQFSFLVPNKTDHSCQNFIPPTFHFHYQFNGFRLEITWTHKQPHWTLFTCSAIEWMGPIDWWKNPTGGFSELLVLRAVKPPVWWIHGTEGKLCRKVVIFCSCSCWIKWLNIINDKDVTNVLSTDSEHDMLPWWPSQALHKWYPLI